MKCLKVNFSAAPSSYKSTVCVGVEALLKQEGIIIDSSEEYAREYINKFGKPVDLFQQLIIMNRQEKNDLSIAAVSQIMLSDYPAPNPFVFGNRMLEGLTKSEKRDITPAEYDYIDEIYMHSRKKCEWFDIIFLFPPNEISVQDNTRTETPFDNFEIFEEIKGFLTTNRIPFHLVEGSTQDRIQKCSEIILEAYKSK